MKKCGLLMIVCFVCLLAFAGCRRQAVSTEPIFQQLELSSILYMDSSETWYCLQESDGALIKASNILKEICGTKIEAPDDPSVESYFFDIVYGEEIHDVGMTSYGTDFYCVLDGTWYTVDKDYGYELAECLRVNGTELTKDEWSHSAKWLWPEMYFWKNTEITCTEKTICYAEVPWASSIDYVNDALTALGILPELEGYTNRSLSVMYDENGSVWGLIANWQYDDQKDHSTYKQLELKIWPKKPNEDEAIDGVISFDPKKLTETKIRDAGGNLIPVYGDGTLESRCKYLIFTLADGSYCQIKACDTVNASDMAVILDYLVTNGVDYSIISKKLRNTYDVITGETVTVEGPYGRLQLTVPEGWNYKINTVEDCEESDFNYGCYSIAIAPETHKGSAVIMCDPTFGVCGTGLVQESIQIAGCKANVGYYDGNTIPAFIHFRDDFCNIVVELFSADDLWCDMHQEFMSILNTLIYDESNQSGAIGIYGDESYIFELGLELFAKKISSGGATIIFDQFDTDTVADTTEIRVSSAFTLERRNGDVWDEVDSAIECNYVFTEGSFVLPHGTVTELKYDWIWCYGELPSGDYRMNLTVNGTPEDGDAVEYDAYAYFIIR